MTSMIRGSVSRVISVSSQLIENIMIRIPTMVKKPVMICVTLC